MVTAGRGKKTARTASTTGARRDAAVISFQPASAQVQVQQLVPAQMRRPVAVLL